MPDNPVPPGRDPAPPEAILLREKRKALAITASDAVRRMRSMLPEDQWVSIGYWRDVERGTGRQRGKVIPVRASDRVLALMAHTVGVTPAQLRDVARRYPAGSRDRERVEGGAAVLRSMGSASTRTATGRQLAADVVRLPARHQLVLRALIDLLEGGDPAAPAAGGEPAAAAIEALTGT